ncbi:MAG: Gfo/Idh/MocA family oxidoreductase [Nanoarchaeota archaeon]|nr:Gfo/Idh/MocA family oxidoreductase [Nanoarchaeota archaeon]
MSKFRVGVIGLGNMGRNHVRIYSETEHATLAAVCDADAAVAKSFSEKYGVPGYSDYEEMLSKEKLDAVSIVVPTKHHLGVALAVAKHNVSILLEKPIALTVEEARDIISACKEHGMMLMVGHIERFNPAIIELKKRLDAKELSEIYKIEVQRCGPFPSRVVDVGVIIDLSVHDLDIISYLTGSKVTQAISVTQKKLHKSQEDSLVAILRYANGMVATLNVNWLSPNKVRELNIYGKEGMFKVDYLTQELYFYENKGLTHRKGQNLFTTVIEGKKTQLTVARVEPLKAELEAFVAHLPDKKSPVPGEEALAALQQAIQLKEESQ